MVAIAYARGTDSPEWKASIETWAPKLPRPEFAPGAARMTADIYNRWKGRLPPKPVAWRPRGRLVGQSPISALVRALRMPDRASMK